MLDNNPPAEGIMRSMSRYACPFCGVLLAQEQINIKEGVAQCAGCGRLSKLSDVMEYAETESRMLQLPTGCSIMDTGNEIHIRATLRSIPKALGALAISLFWNGIVSVFVLLAIAGLWSNLIGPMPDYFPAPEVNDKPMSLGMAIFLWIFLTPFIVLGAGMIFSIFLYLAGRVDVRVSEYHASARTSVGPFRWTKRFDPNAVTKVTIGETFWRSNDSANPLIQIDADDTIKFGSSLSEVRRDWLRAVLQVLLLQPNSPQYDEVMKQSETRQRF